MMDIVENIFSEALNNNVRTDELITKYADLRSEIPMISDLKSLRNRDGLTLLHIAAGAPKLKLASYLIDQGSEINAQNRWGQTPLHAAARHGHSKMVKLLLDAGADVNLMDCEGWTALFRAIGRRYNAKKIQEKSWDVIRILLDAGADPYLITTCGMRYLDKVKDSEDKREIRLLHLCRLIDKQPDEESRSLAIDNYLIKEDFFELIMKGDEQIDRLKKLTSLETINFRLEIQIDGYQNSITPLHLAAGHGKLGPAMLLIDKGALLDVTDERGRSPLHYAAKWGHIEMIVYLVEKGACVDLKDCGGLTPLHLAAHTEDTREEDTLAAAFTLIRLGADRSSESAEGKLPYDLAKSNNMQEILRPSKCLLNRKATDETLMILPFSCDDKPLMFDLNSEFPDIPNCKLSLQKSDLRYQAIETMMNGTIVTHPSDCCRPYSHYDIVEICIIINKKLWDLYVLESKSIYIRSKNVNERLLYHGSKFVEDIISEGFEERCCQLDGMFGAGIYFAAHSSKSNQYTFGFKQGCLKHDNVSCNICERKMILAQVALGKSLETMKAMPNQFHAPPRHDSITGMPGTDLNYPEYAIYRGVQAYPLYEIKYRINY